MSPKQFRCDFNIFLDYRKREWSNSHYLHVRNWLKLLTNINKVISFSNLVRICFEAAIFYDGHSAHDHKTNLFYKRFDTKKHLTPKQFHADFKIFLDCWKREYLVSYIFDVSISLVSQKLLPFEKMCFSYVVQVHWITSTYKQVTKRLLLSSSNMTHSGHYGDLPNTNLSLCI